MPMYINFVEQRTLLQETWKNWKFPWLDVFRHISSLKISTVIVTSNTTSTCYLLTKTHLRLQSLQEHKWLLWPALWTFLKLKNCVVRIFHKSLICKKNINGFVRWRVIVNEKFEGQKNSNVSFAINKKFVWRERWRNTSITGSLTVRSRNSE